MERLVKAIDDANDYQLFNQPFPIEIHETADQTQVFALLKGIEAGTFSTPHTRESLALRLTDGHSALVYSSDTGYAEALAEFASGVDLLILECSFRRDKPTPKHLELAEAMRLAKIAEPRKLLLTHLYPEWDGIDIEAQARQLWPGETIAARDGLRLNLQD